MFDAASFHELGYARVPGVFGGEALAGLEAEFDRIVAQVVASGEQANARWGGAEMERMGAAGTVVLHTHNVQCYSAAWLRALLEPAFLAPLQAVLGPDVVLHHTKLFQKPPELGAPFPMHQDWGYFPTVRDTMMAAVVHVSDADDEMGCLRVYPGSHKAGRMGGAMGQDALEGFPLEGGTPVEAQAGDVVLFHYLTVHGSMPNRSSRTRKTVLVQVHAGDDRVEPGNAHPDARLALSGWNATMTRERADA